MTRMSGSGRGGCPVTELELEAWDAVWQRYYDRGVLLGMTPNQSVHRAYREMSERFGQRPSKEINR